MTTATAHPAASRRSRTSEAPRRQQLLFLYLTHAHPSSETIGWSLFDGAGDGSTQAGDSDQPPYGSVLAAMRDGWRVIQVSQQQPAYPGMEQRTAFLPYEFVLERLVTPDQPTGDQP
jgi:hypothetical protein